MILLWNNGMLSIVHFSISYEIATVYDMYYITHHFAIGS